MEEDVSTTAWTGAEEQQVTLRGARTAHTDAQHNKGEQTPTCYLTDFIGFGVSARRLALNWFRPLFFREGRLFCL